MTVDTKELRALRAKMTLPGKWQYIGDGQIEVPDPSAPEFPWLIAETVPDDDAAGIVALVNAADALIADNMAMKARVAELEGEVARLREALIDAGDVLAQAAKPARVDPDQQFSRQVKALGDAFGYGALMTTASALWREVLGDLAGAEFAAGPCVSTAASRVVRIDAALGETP